jgi:hypothetical protein
MLRFAILGAGLLPGVGAVLLPGVALACPGHLDGQHADVDAAANPAACAKKAELVGGACSYTTGMMAQRVLMEGSTWTYSGRLTRFDGTSPANVAAPFTVGPDSVYVIGNEVVEELVAAGAQGGRVALEGRRLDVDGVKYFVITGFAAGNS